MRNAQDFRIHASQCHKIMGRIGLTDKQLTDMNEYTIREGGVGRPLTDNMRAELSRLRAAHANPELPDTCKTHLREWYAGDREEIRAKQIDKGNMVEDDNIDFLARVAGYGMGIKNTEIRSDEYMVGTCDVDFPDAIGETKAPWNNTTLQSQTEWDDDASPEMSPEYEWQLRVYMRLWDKPVGILFHGLQNTPEIDGREPVSYDHIPESERWIGYRIKRDLAIEAEIIERVKLCRKWLVSHDAKVKSRLGKFHEC